MKDRLVTLIGGGGFVGRYVAQELLRAGARVRIAQRRPGRAFFLKPLGGLGQTQFIAADVTRPDTIARAVAGSDAVVNLVGAWDDFDALHVRGAENIAKAAAAAGAESLLHVSALGADPEAVSEYGRSKAQGEAAVLAAFPSATIFRPAAMFGREDNFVNRFAGMIAGAPLVPVLKPTGKLQPVYVADVAEAAVQALADRETHGGKTYELAGPDVMTMLQLFRWIADAIGRNPGFMELPDSLGALIAAFGFLPGAPITGDQWKMLARDNIASGPGLAALGVHATPLAVVAPQWLVRFRKHGRFARLGETA
jgi:NADH dehydrogenase